MNNQKHKVLVSPAALLALVFFAAAVPLRADPADVVINEINYHPEPDCEYEEFIEIYNRGETIVDLSNWRFIEGVIAAFPEGTILRPKEFLLVAKYPDRVAAAFNIPADRIFPYSGSLSNNGEDIVLVDAAGVQIDRVRYNDRFPWPTSCDGGGPSLELRNPFEENDWAGNWGPAGRSGPRWRRYEARGSASENVLRITLDGPGEFLIDDVSLRRTGGGPELITDGGFEDPALTSWQIQGNHAQSYRDTSNAFSGSAALHVKATGGGGGTDAVLQIVSGLQTDGTEYVLSFWALRLTPGRRLRVAIAGSTPLLDQSRDIGAVGAAGSSELQDGVYTVQGSGADIWGSNDEFHYLYTNVTGDVTIEATCTWVTAPNSWSKAGLMIRESTAPNSKHVMNILSRDNGVALQWRPNTGSSSSHNPGPAVSTTARLRLSRQGNTFRASWWSGSAWEEFGSVSVSMSQDVLVGLCVTAHQDGSTATATFQEVVLNGMGGGISAVTDTEEPAVMATPLAPNTQFTLDVPPFVHKVLAYAATGNPQDPYRERISSSDEVHILATVEDTDPVTKVELHYQVVRPGAYIRIEDPEYEQNWTVVPMNDAGTGPDATAGDGVYTAAIPPLPHRTLVRYRIFATAGGKVTRVPYPDDEMPNFAYFVYDGVPDYICDVRSEYGPVPYVHPKEGLVRVPVFHLICRDEDLFECEADAIPFGDKIRRKLLRWQGTLVYDNPMIGGERIVIDNVRFRLRGGVWRYSWPKRMYKIVFPRGHHLKAHYNNGEKFPEPRRKLNLNSIIDQDWTGVRGISGIHEALAFWLFRQAGVAASHTTWVHFRTITKEREQGQYDGDFKGLFLEVEQPDAGLLNTNDRPLGNLYKVDTGAVGYEINTLTGERIRRTGRPERWDKEVTNCIQSELDDDIADFYDTYRSGTQSAQWWEEHLDLDRYFSYRVVLDSIRHYDIQAGKNYYYYHNSDTDLWEVFPWDTDLILRATCCGDTTFGEGEPFWRPVIEAYPDTFGVAYRNRFREYLQFVANRQNLDPLVDYWVDLIKPLHEADRDRWDYFPVPDGYPIKGDSPTAQWGLYRSIDQRVAEMRAELDRRLAFCWSNTSNFCGYDAAHIPDQPSIVVPASSPVELDPEDLVFTSSAFSDPDGDGFASARWQATRIRSNSDDFNWTNELAPDYAEVLTRNMTTWTVPPDALQLGEEYLVRVRYEDTTGRMSLWSDPVRIRVVDLQSRKPEAAFEASVYSGGAPLEVVFDASDSSDPDGDPLSFFWDFGDGSTGEGSTVVHRFMNVGTYTVTLVVDDGRGRRDSASTLISVLNCSNTEGLILETSPGGRRGVVELQVEPQGGLEIKVKVLLVQYGSDSLPGIRSWSFGVTHDPSVLQLVSVSQTPELAGVLGSEPYTSTRIRANGFTQAVILSTRTLMELPAGLASLPVAEATYRLVADHGVVGSSITTALRFTDTVGSPPVEILINRALEGYLPCETAGLQFEILVVGEVVPRFLRGDTNSDGARDISDAVAVLRYLFAGASLGCLDAADVNDDGRLTIADPVALLGYLFGSGAPLPEPFEAPGPDPTDDSLDCAEGF